MNQQDTITLWNQRTSASILLGGMIIAALLLFSIASKGLMFTGFLREVPAEIYVRAVSNIAENVSGRQQE